MANGSRTISREQSRRARHQEHYELRPLAGDTRGPFRYRRYADSYLDVAQRYAHGRRIGISDPHIEAPAEVRERVLEASDYTAFARIEAHPTPEEQNLVAQVTHLASIALEREQAAQALADLAGKLIHAQEEERKRIDREVHDHISQTLGLLLITIDQLLARGEITSDIAAAIENLRRERHDIAITFAHESLPARLPSDVALCLFRVAEESLANIAKHSQATSASLHITGTSDGIHLRIEDAGTGFDLSAFASRAGLGVVSMQERLRALHGTMHIDSAPLRGTRIDAWVPPV